jgi:hypothetical protein
MSAPSKSTYDLLFNAPLPNDIYEMELIGDHRFSAAVPIQANAELKKRILGAIKSYYGNLTSIDYTIKRYGQRWQFEGPTEDQRFVVNTLKNIDEKVSELLTAIMNGRPRPDSAGLLAAEVAVLRLKSSFRSALILVSQAYAFEAAAIVRLALEQIAWAYAIHKLEDPEKILRVEPTRAISDLKRLAAFAGPLYGALTAQAHVNPDKAKIYYTEDGDGTVEIRHQLSDESFVVLGYLLGVLSLFRQVVLAVLGPYVDKPSKPRLWRRSPYAFGATGGGADKTQGISPVTQLDARRAF